VKKRGRGELHSGHYQHAGVCRCETTEHTKLRGRKPRRKVTNGVVRSDPSDGGWVLGRTEDRECGLPPFELVASREKSVDFHGHIILGTHRKGEDGERINGGRNDGPTPGAPGGI